jgi:hypothetical protein
MAGLAGDLCGDVGDFTVELARDEEGESGSSASSRGPLVVLLGNAALLESLRACVDMIDRWEHPQEKSSGEG